MVRPARLAALLGSLVLGSSLASAAGTQDRPLPQKRTYDSHHYYAVDLHSRERHTDPRDIAEVLGVELVERVGELEGVWLVRSEKQLDIAKRGAGVELEGEDRVLKRWTELKGDGAQLVTRSEALHPRHLAAATAIRSVEKQVLRKRHKRDVIYSPWDTPQYYPQVRAPIPGPEPQPYPDPLPPPTSGSIDKIGAMTSKFSIQDPIFKDQWHLANNKINDFDLNITTVWEDGITGKGVRVCLIDDGLDFKSPDLKENFFEAGSYDFNAHTALPEPRLSDDQHGTRCAGEIAALKNDVCGVGVAYGANVAGVRILSGPITDVDEAAALNYRYQENHIYSCSWGPPDDGRSMDAPKGLIAKAILNGVQNGRDGLGSIFVFAGGNGGASDDQCNFDGYTNSIYSMTIAAVDREGLHPYYSEMCAATIASGWSSGSGDHIHTTDVAWNGVNRCTSTHGGTSAAAPLVAGVVALALEARPDLTWRDMQHIAVHSAQMINPDDKDWQKTQAGRHFNHKYGYGIIDAKRFVDESKNHKLVNPQAWMTGPNITIPKDQTFIGDGGVKSTFTVTEEMLKGANLAAIEHVTVRVWITHERRGDVNVELTSPHGTRSVLARSRRYDDATTGFPGWGFMTLKHWDESPVGEWTMEVFDKSHPKKTGNFWAWGMTLWGASIDPLKAKPWNFPEDSVEFHETLEGAPATTSVHLPPGYTPNPTGADEAKQRPKPTDHLPDDHGSAPGESHQDFTNGNAPSPEADTGYLSGLSKKKSTWVFAASGIVLIFAASVAAFFILRRRRASGRGGRGGRRSAGEGEGYEFIPGGDDDDEEDNVAMASLGGAGKLARAAAAGASKIKGKGAKRTKELYDAFGEASSQEDDDEDDALVGGGQHPQKYRDLPVYEDEEGDQRFTIGGAGGGDDTNDSRGGQLLFDAEEVHDEKQGESEEGSGGSGSWQDAGAEAKE
ncbi:hypothetical protein FA10DRAFT_263457 [Acaromyces ingoldii]|uniref:P/Homo B domain-containing protein n=1 Tax=Acaromyces ingoldii TaxID=215250 RepID=A0A316YTT5_9BASI|nr:hypothetical protein FA10DRAFT_263457 [Acaromyces ingoldii]PWN92699.1 hypothetical protein FA10DRAFT_263457 [Acaromyces ingoldii]